MSSSQLGPDSSRPPNLPPTRPVQRRRSPFQMDRQRQFRSELRSIWRRRLGPASPVLRSSPRSMACPPIWPPRWRTASRSSSLPIAIDAALEHLRHSTAHVLAQAVLELWPGATFAGGPPIADGFYYDFELPERATFSDDDLAAIDARIREIIAADQPFERIELPIDEAMALMVDHPYKRTFALDATIAGNAADGEVDAPTAGDSATISFYAQHRDVCGHVPGPTCRQLAVSAISSSCGWRAPLFVALEDPMLQRIYGTTWASKKDLATHLNRLEEAKERPPPPWRGTRSVQLSRRSARVWPFSTRRAASSAA